MFKKQFCITLFIFVGILLYSQSDIRFNNYWENLYTLNPAAIDDAYLASLSAGIRQQWFNFPGAPRTIMANGSIYLEDYYSQFGLKALRDKIGYTNTSYIDLSYAYAVTLDKYWQMNLGLALSFQDISYDRSEISLPSFDDPVAYDRLIRESNFNAGLGFELLYNSQWRFGAASKNIFSLFIPINDIHANVNYLYAMYRQYNRDYMNLGVGITGIQYSNIFQAELSMTAFFKKTTDRNSFQLGLFYRTWREMGALLGFDIANNFKLSYSYDFNVGQIYRRSLGTHELILTWKFDKARRCRICWY